MGVDKVSRPAVFLDRDGVLVAATVREGRPYAPERLEDLRVLPGVPESLRRLKSAGLALIVVTNQPDVARGRLSRGTVEAMHSRLMSMLPLDECRVCYHDDADGCDCRKPAPGLLTRPPLFDLDRSVIVGDRWRDIEAGRRAGCRATILVDHGYDEGHAVSPDLVVGSLVEATDWILATMVQT
jgi:D-glycero-D-manno-heptose 1,7-bisphosphate phosphatase